MATASKVGRNDRCPCGSGKKYKACCALKKRELSKLQWLVIVAVVVVVVVALASAFSTSSEDTATSFCPPGQYWSMEHGHCH